MSDGSARLLEADFLEEQTFRGGDLAESDLGSKELVRCTFKNVKMMQSRWKGARLEDCVFDGCDLTRIAPAGLMARGVRFTGCKMIGIDWSDLGAQHIDCGAQLGRERIPTQHHVGIERCEQRLKLAGAGKRRGTARPRRMDLAAGRAQQLASGAASVPCTRRRARLANWRAAAGDSSSSSTRICPNP